MSTDETVELDEERKREILALEAKVDGTNLFEILGVPVGASVDEVKAAFRECSRRYHPDKYFGKRLGSYKPRLDKIFRRLLEAHQTLSDEAKRRAYLEANPSLRPATRSHPSGSGLVAEPGAEKTEAERSRDAERRARLARHPYLLKATKVQESLTRAREAVKKKEYSLAFTYLNQAAVGDPGSLEVKALLAEVRKLNEAERALSSFQHGEEALRRMEEPLAIQAFKLAAHGGHAQAAFKVAQLLERQQADLREVTGFAQRAVELDPKNPEYRVYLGRLLDQGGMKALAKKHFDEAVKLDPGNAEVKKHVKKLWPF